MAGPGGIEVGRASVRVLPDTSKFRQSLQKYLDRTEKSFRVQIPLGVDSSKFNSEVTRAVKVAQSAAGSLDVNLAADSSRLRAGVTQAVRTAQSTAGDIDVDMDVDGSQAARQARRARERAEDAANPVRAKISLNVGRFIAAARAAARTAGTALVVQAKLTLNTKPFMAALAAARTASHFFGASVLKNAVVNLPALVGSLGMATVALGGLAGPLAAIGGAAISALGPITALAGGLSISGIGSAALAIGTLKAAFSGMGEALGADTIEDFNAAIEGMPPAAQDAARSLWDVKSAFSDLGQEVQDNFWSNFSNVGDLASLVEPIREAMSGLAMDMGNAAAGFTTFITQGQGLASFETMLGAASSAASTLSYAFASVLEGLVSIGAAAAPILSELTAGIQEAAARWAESMHQGLADGSLEATMRSGLDTLREFGAFMGQLGGIITGVFSAAAASGAPFLGTLGSIVSATNDWVNSAEGMSVLTGFFDQMNGAVQAIMPSLGILADSILGTVAPAIAQFIQAIGPGLQAAVAGLAGGVAAIAPAIAPLGAAFGQVLAAAAPLLPVLGQVIAVIADSLTSAMSTVAPLVSSFAEALGNVSPSTIAIGVGVAGAVAGIAKLIPVVSGLANIFKLAQVALGAFTGPLGLIVGVIALVITAMTQVPGAMEPLKGAMMAIMDAVQPLISLIMQLAQQLIAAIMPVIIALIPVIIQIAQTIAQIITVIMPIIEIILQLAATIISALMPVVTSLIPVISALVSIIGSIVTALVPVIQVIVSVIAMFATLLATIVGFVGSALGMIISFVSGVIAGFVSMIAETLSIFTGWVGNLLSWFARLYMSLVSSASNMWNSVVGAFSTGIGIAISFVSQMPGRARDAMGNVGSILIDSGRALIQGFINGIKSMIGAVADAARGAVKAARDFFPFSPAKRGPFSGRGYTTYSGKALARDFAGGISSQAGLAARAAGSLMSAAAGNLSGYKADAGTAGLAVAGRGGGGAGVDTSVHIGQLVAADMSAPLEQVKTMQLRAQIKAGIA